MNDKEIKTAILEALKEAESRTLSVKKLKKLVIGESDDLDKKFSSILDEMSLGKKISIEDGKVTKLSKRTRDDGKEENQKSNFKKGERDEHGNLKSNKSAKYENKVLPVQKVEFDIDELWKNGEQVYRQGLLVILNSPTYTFLRIGIGL
jgi:ABC-type Zn2+ transport system substrate-binding protein/surface adhesin